MTRSLMILGLMLTSLFGLGCSGRSGSASTMPDGSRIAVMVHVDERITPDMAPDRVTQIQQLSQWMENDLLEMLDGTGYAGTRVEDPAATPPGPGRLLLRVSITDYNAGSKAARMLVGFGAGTAVLRTHFDLYADASSGPIVSGDPDVGSSRDWTNAARKVNQQTVDSVNLRLHQPITAQANSAAPLVQPADGEPAAAEPAPISQALPAQ